MVFLLRIEYILNLKVIKIEDFMSMIPTNVFKLFLNTNICVYYFIKQ